MKKLIIHGFECFNSHLANTFMPIKTFGLSDELTTVAWVISNQNVYSLGKKFVNVKIMSLGPNV